MADPVSKEPVIKIFVSHRIDQVSETIDNPLYVNVRCGAVYDKREPEEYGHMLGDDIGDNISDKKERFCELTVQYWAWKNVKADYYGLCHYRRYLSFSDEKYKTRNGEHDAGCVGVTCINPNMIQKYHLTDQKKVQQELEDYDVILDEPIDISKTFRTNYHQMEMAPTWHNMKDVDTALEILAEKYPEMKEAADEYMHKTSKTRLYNCFIMRSDIFNNYCEYLFSILFELEKRMDTTHYSDQMNRSIGTIGERLFAIYCFYLQKQKKYRIKVNQLLFIDYTNRRTDLLPAFSANNVPIVLVANNYYVPYLYVFLKSVIKFATPEHNYDIIVFQKDFTSENKKVLEQLAMEHGLHNISIRFYNPTYELGNAHFFMNTTQVSVETYYRMLAPWILHAYEKAIVMDCDIIANHDIAELYDIDVSKVLAAGVADCVYQGWLNGTDPTAYKYTTDVMEMKNPYNYVNTGVLLMNLDLWRKSYTLDEIIKMETNCTFRIREQDLLNVLFEGKFTFIDVRWNYYLPVNDSVKYALQFAIKDAKKQYDDAAGNPYLIHWASAPKPWNAPEVPMADKWWEFARNTPFYEAILGRMIDFKNNGVHVWGGLQLSFARRVADKLLPKGSGRREALKKVMPRGSKQFELLKRLYHKFTF